MRQLDGLAFAAGVFVLLIGMLAMAPTAYGGSQVFTDGFETGYPCSWSSANPSVQCPPEFDGLALVAATGTTEITLGWMPAVDDTTPSSQIIYRVYLSTDPGFTPGPSTLVTSVTGGTSVVVQGLEKETSYFVVVAAEDEDGMRTPRVDVAISKRLKAAELEAVTTLSVDPELNDQVVFQKAEDLYLGEAVATDSTLTFQRSQASVAPTVGAILIGPKSGGGGYVRTVESVDVGASEIVVQTSSASLEALADVFELSSDGTVHETSEEKTAALNALKGKWQPLGQRKPVVEVATRYFDGNNTGWLRVSPAAEAESAPAFQAEKAGWEYDSEFDLNVSLDFEPTLQTRAKWSLFGGIKEAEVIAKGTLTFDALAKFQFQGTGEFNPENVKIWTGTWTAVYSVGPVPVYQQITLDIELEVSANAQVAVEAVASAWAEAELELGVRYNKATGEWDAVFGPGFDNELEASLDVVGGAHAEVRLIPKVSVEFYEAISAWISLEPSITGDLAFEDAFGTPCTPLELTDFTVNFNMVANAGIDFTLIGSYELWSGSIWEPDPIPMFSLPEFTLSQVGDDPPRILAEYTNGINNEFNIMSSSWSVSPSTADVFPLRWDWPVHAELRCSEDGIYTVTYSGYGELGDLARRCKQIEVYCNNRDNIIEIIDSSGDGLGNTLQGPAGVAVDQSGNVFVVGAWGNNVFRITPSGSITEVLNSSGDGIGNALESPAWIAVDESGSAYVTGLISDNAFEISPDGTVAEIIDSSGDGAGNELNGACDIAVDDSLNVYVTGKNSNNAFKITPSGVITEIINHSGDGAGNVLDTPVGVAVDDAGNIYLAACLSHNAFRVSPEGEIAEIIDALGDGLGNTLVCPQKIAVDDLGNVYVTGFDSNNAFKVSPSGAITKLIDATGDGTGNTLAGPVGVSVNDSKVVYVTGAESDNVFEITTEGQITEILDLVGAGSEDGQQHPLYFPTDIEVGAAGVVYVTGNHSHNAFKVIP